MFDAANARRLMVEGQVRTADVSDTNLLDAMATVPREKFLPASIAPLAYLDNDIQIAKGRALLRPMVLAKLIQAARIKASDHVLDVACGTGYSSAVLARLAESVVALEDDAELARGAKESLASVGVNAVEVMVGPLSAGWPAGGTYDVILINGSAEIVPDAFAGQLKPEGRLLAIFGRTPATKGTIFHLVEGRLAGRPIFDGAARLLPGFAAPQSFVF
jgi:protein-L-isoaspartate(D-aspartate) O-methyltransferase